VQVKPISRRSLESYIKTLLNTRTSNNELQLAIAEDNLQKMNLLFQAIANGLNLATVYSISSTYVKNQSSVYLLLLILLYFYFLN